MHPNTTNLFNEYYGLLTINANEEILKLVVTTIKKIKNNVRHRCSKRLNFSNVHKGKANNFYQYMQSKPDPNLPTVT